MSGYTAGTIPDRDLVDRDTALLSKPFTPWTLGVSVREILDRHRKPRD